MRFSGRRVKGLVGVIVLGFLGSGIMAHAAIGQPKDQLMIVVNDVPFDRVWQAILNTVGPLVISREDKGQGVVVSESEWPSQGVDRLAYDRVRETVTVRLERFDPLTTKVGVVVEVQKRKRGGDWVQEAPSRGAEQMILSAISERLRSRR
ncbi:MAG: hypothetical protein HYS14_03665 [Candidatus Rokubacteria bacterium]|nr:hypothetical protein [Candidatus Rokubacteria bacterium]